MSKKGFSLIEVLVTLGILGIFTGIATVSYQGYIFDVTKRTLKDSGTLFQVAVNTCIQRNGGWKIYRFTRAGESCSAGKTTEPCKEMTPCRAEQQSTSKATHDELKSKLSFTCPADATCAVHTHSVESTYRYHCLSIQKKVSGKKLQVVVRIPYDNPSDYHILCGDKMSQTAEGDYMPLDNTTCKASGFQKLHDYGFSKGETKAKAGQLKQIIPCPWK